MNRSERGLVVGWVTRVFENPFDMSGTFEKFENTVNAQGNNGKTPAHPKTQIQRAMGNHWSKISQENLYLKISNTDHDPQ